MRAGAEDPAIDRVHLNNEVLWYESTVDSYVPGLDYFAQSITVNFGRYDTTTHTEGPRLGGGTFPLGTTPPNCPVTAAQSAAVPPGAAAAGPAAGATAAPHTSGTTLSFQSTLKICHRLLRSRTFHVPNGGLRVRIGAQWFDPSGRNIQSRADCPITEFHVSLEQSGTFWDSEISDTAIPVGHAQAIRWRYLDPGDYYLNIWTLNDDPNCCLTGEISVSTFDAPRPVRSRTPMIA